jgi:putative autotransporter adhesin-like protein
MQRLIPIGATLLASGLAAGCSNYHGDYHTMPGTEPTAVVIGSGRFVSETRPIANVATIAVSGAIRLQVEHTGEQSLTITAEDNLLPLLESVVANDRLSLGWKPGIGSVQSHGVDVRVGVPEVRGIDASGACSVDGVDFHGGDFRITLSGASQFTGTGTVDRLDADLSGASRMTAPALTARIANVTLSGASTALLRVTGSLFGSATGASLLEFLGDPIVQVETSGTSVVRRAGP